MQVLLIEWLLIVNRIYMPECLRNHIMLAADFLQLT